MSKSFSFCRTNINECWDGESCENHEISSTIKDYNDDEK